jgi:hypothetical protein
MRLVLNERGQMIETCYLCEREKKPKDDSTVIDKLRKRDRDDGRQAHQPATPAIVHSQP